MESTRNTPSAYVWKERQFPETGDVVIFDSGLCFDDGHFWDQETFSWTERIWNRATHTKRRAR